MVKVQIATTTRHYYHFYFNRWQNATSETTYTGLLGNTAQFKACDNSTSC